MRRPPELNVQNPVAAVAISVVAINAALAAVGITATALSAWVYRR